MPTWNEVKAAKAARQRGTEHKMQAGARPDQGGKGSTKVATPPVRPEVQALADELHVDLSTVTGTGANGSIRMRDVREAAAAVKTSLT